MDRQAETIKLENVIALNKLDLPEHTISIPLPPQVEGIFNGEVEVCVPCIIWGNTTTSSKAVKVTSSCASIRILKNTPFLQVRLKWWGESGHGTLFRPHLDSTEKAAKTNAGNTVLFPVMCNLDHLLRYMADMVRVLHSLFILIVHLTLTAGRTGPRRGGFYYSSHCRT